MHTQQTDVQTKTTTQEALMLKPCEAASIAGVSVRTITRLCVEGKIKATKLGSSWRINRAAFLLQLGIEA